VGGTGLGSGGKYMGIAPSVNLVSVRVANNLGEALTSDVVDGLQWVLDNRLTYNIRVVNLSLNSTTAESYHTNPWRPPARSCGSTASSWWSQRQ